MSRILAIAIAAMLVAGPSSATAACVIVPDGPESRYVENGMAHSLCLQRELASDVEWRADMARINANLEAMRIELERQRQQALAAARAAL